MNGAVLAAVLALLALPSGAASVAIENAWIRAPAPGRQVAAGYCDIRNAGRASATVVGFSAPFRVEMHETRMEQGMARMRLVRAIEVPARSTTKLAPGGKHLMLFDVDAAMLDAGRVDLRARLASGEEIAATFEVRGRPRSAGATAAEATVDAPQEEEQ